MKQLNIDVERLKAGDLDSLIQGLDDLKQQAVEQKRKRENLFLASVESLLNSGDMELKECTLTVCCDGKAFTVSEQKRRGESSSRAEKINSNLPVGTYRIRRYRGENYKVTREAEKVFTVGEDHFKNLTDAANAVYQGKTQISGVGFWIDAPTSQGPFSVSAE